MTDDTIPTDRVHPMRRHDDHDKMIEATPRKIPVLERVLLPAVVAAVTAFSAVMLWAIIEPEPYQPLTYDVQRIVNVNAFGVENVPQVNGSDLIPSIEVGDSVPAVGGVCNHDNRDVRVSGSIHWNRLDVLGTTIPVGSGTDSITPGCAALGPYRNPMPQAVVETVTGEGEPSLWRITGHVVIDEPNGGATSWETESFWVVP